MTCPLRGPLRGPVGMPKLLTGVPVPVAGRNGTPPNPKVAAELDTLAKNHGKDTLKAIGATCDPTLDPKCK